MRICYLALGEFLHVDPYLEFFSASGHDVHFVSLAPGPTRAVPTHEVGLGPRALELCGKAAYFPAMLRARRVIRSLAPDILHAHYATSAGLSAFLTGFHPWVVTAHGTDLATGIKSPFRRMLLRRLFTNADCVNPVSQELRQMVLRLGIPDSKILTLTLGIDSAQFKFAERNFAQGAAPLKLICTRRMEPVYNHETLLRAMALLKRRNFPFHLTLLGDGVSRPNLQQLARTLGLTNDVRFLGAVPNSQLPLYLAQNDVYLSASTRDGTSLSLLEAMAVGLYPVVSDINANREWLDHRRNGLLFAPLDPEALANCIAAFSNSAGQAPSAVRHNRRLVIERGDRTGNMKRLEQAYSQLLHAPNSHAAPPPNPKVSAATIS
ncbi:MAG TPA: glycosyltransferase [Verrucomicrobiae bacterium]|nr:glycosyltransferase [Verrucomicrobiae bacterium]